MSPWILQCRVRTPTGRSSWGNAATYTDRVTVTWAIHDLMRVAYGDTLGSDILASAKWRLKNRLTGEIITPKDIDHGLEA